MGDLNGSVGIHRQSLDTVVNQRLRRNDVGRGLHCGNTFVDQHLRQLHLHFHIAVGEHIDHVGFVTQSSLDLADLLLHHLQPHTAGAVRTHATGLAQGNDHVAGGNAIGHGAAIEGIFQTVVLFKLGIAKILCRQVGQLEQYILRLFGGDHHFFVQSMYIKRRVLLVCQQLAAVFLIYNGHNSTSLIFTVANPQGIAVDLHDLNLVVEDSGIVEQIDVILVLHQILDADLIAQGAVAMAGLTAEA